MILFLEIWPCFFGTTRIGQSSPSEQRLFDINHSEGTRSKYHIRVMCLPLSTHVTGAVTARCWAGSISLGRSYFFYDQKH